MKQILTQEMVTKFRALRDNPDLFKDTYAKNQSYVASALAYSIIFETNQRSVVIALIELLEKIKLEIRQIITNIELDLEFPRNLFDFDHATYFSNFSTDSKIIFKHVRNYTENDHNLVRGMATSYIYYGGDHMNICRGTPWMAPTEIPNLLANCYKK